MPQLRRKIAGSAPPPPSDVKLRKVIPLIPSKEPKKSQLMQDLTFIGCLGFVEKPWEFREERMVRELLDKLSNQFDNTERGLPHLWTEELWRAVYKFKQQGLGMANRKDEFIHGKFRGAPHLKDGYKVEDFIDDRHQCLLKFLLPVFHPKKLTRVMITLRNTIFGVLVGDRKVDWGWILSLVGAPDFLDVTDERTSFGEHMWEDRVSATWVLIEYDAEMNTRESQF